MPEADGTEIMYGLKKAHADMGDVFQKVEVNGENTAPLYKFLKHRQPGWFGSDLKWNFTKFLIDKNGQPVRRFAPTTLPEKISKHIDGLLNDFETTSTST